MTDAQTGPFTITRSTPIAAPPEIIFSLIDDFHAWSKWSPWETVDGDELVKTYSGPQRGLGSIYEWSGKKTGQGRMEIKGLMPFTRIEIDLQFLKPFKNRNLTAFNMTPASGVTEVVWTMTGKSTLMSRVMGLFMNMDKMVGSDFEKGLVAMKALAER